MSDPQRSPLAHLGLPLPLKHEAATAAKPEDGNTTPATPEVGKKKRRLR